MHALDMHYWADAGRLQTNTVKDREQWGSQIVVNWRAILSVIQQTDSLHRSTLPHMLPLYVCVIGAGRCDMVSHYANRMVGDAKLWFSSLLTSWLA